MFAGPWKTFVYVCLILVFGVAAVSSLESSSDVITNENNKSRYNLMENDIYLLVYHLIRTAIYIFFSGLFAGLTIGIMSMDTLTFDIIATSGPEPDRSYASRVLPLRRQGHQTLCTLILSNILMNVLIVQEIAAIIEIVNDLEGRWWIQKAVKKSSELSSFIISTLIIVIFTEIIPMSICKSKYSLRIAAAGYILVRVANIVAYPVVMPLSKVLDYFLPHGVGQIYDRNELRKLMTLHCEAHGDRSGLARSEMLLLIAAMDFHEKKVSEIMAPIECVTTVKSDEIITVELIQRLWESGRSRIPVEELSNGFLGVLLIKDLLTLPVRDKNVRPMTVSEVVRSKSRPVACVGVNTPLPVLLRFFQQSKIHMLFVFCEDRDSIEVCGKDSDCVSNIYSSTCKSGNAICSNVVGVVTLEDVMEALIQDEIYDEYDDRLFSTHEIPLFKKAALSMPLKNMVLPLEEPVPKPRVNFFSFFTFQSPSSLPSSSQMMTATPLTDSQVWAVAYYLTRAVSAFCMWHPGYVKMLLDECRDEQFFPRLCASEISSPEAQLETNQKESSKFVFLRGKQTPFSLSPSMSSALSECTHPANYTDLISIATAESFVLYRNGVQSDIFTLILGGRVDAAVGPQKFPLTRGPLEFFGENALRLPCYIPDFDAVIIFPARIYRVTRECYQRYLCYNDSYSKFYTKYAAECVETKSFSFSMDSKTLSAAYGGNSSLSYLRKNESDELLPSEKNDAFYGTF